jgi:hypothetical protein
MKTKMPKKVHAALGVLLEEFGEADLEPRLKYFRQEGDDKSAQKLEDSFKIVTNWWRG